MLDLLDKETQIQVRQTCQQLSSLAKLAEQALMLQLMQAGGRQPGLLEQLGTGIAAAANRPAPAPAPPQNGQRERG